MKPSLPETMPMTRFLTAAISLMVIACMSSGTALAQQKVYQWKDAKGRTHYSSAPPASGTFTVRGVKAGPATPPPATTASATKPEAAQCKQAKGNLEILRGNANVRIDSDGDGQPDRLLNPDEHAAQVKLAESIIGVSCAGQPKT